MKYIGQNGTEIHRTGLTVRRDLSFILTDPGRFDTNTLLDILYRKAGGIIETISLFGTYQNPTTGTLSHNYHLFLRCKNSGSKAGLAFPIEKVNELMHEIELEMEASMPVRFPSYHITKVV